MQSPAPLTVLGLVALATTAIVCGDTAGKLLTGAGVQPLFVAWSRFALAALLSAATSADDPDEALDMYLSLQLRFQKSGISAASLRPAIDRHWQELRALSGRIVPARRVA